MSSSQNIPYSMRIKQLEGRVMAAAKLVNLTAQEFSGMDYQQSARITRTLGQMSVVVQPTTNPRYEVAPCCTSNEFNYCPPPGDIILVGPPTTMTVSVEGYDLAIDISWIPEENVVYSQELTYNNGSGNTTLSDFIINYHTPTNITIYTLSSYNHIILTIISYPVCARDTDDKTVYTRYPLN